jgi:SAM-dependent methyltransferase
LSDYLARNRESWTTANAEFTDKRARSDWLQAEITWGMCHARETDVEALPDYAGKDATARELNEELGLGIEYVEANAEETGLPSESFDLAVSEYGASIWCDPYKWIPEAARLLRPGGELVFLRNATLAILCATESETTSKTLQRPQRGLHRLDWEDDNTTEFQMGHSEWVRVLRANDFEIVDLYESYANENTPDHTYYAWTREWAERWPWEEIWRARKR